MGLDKICVSSGIKFLNGANFFTHFSMRSTLSSDKGIPVILGRLFTDVRIS